METPVATLLRDGRLLRLQHGPIDVVLGCSGDATQRERVFRAASARFTGVLESLVSELPLLRRELPSSKAEALRAIPGERPREAIARSMWHACEPYAMFRVTPMVAVAGAVADALLNAARSVTSVHKVWVNNGGDIAVHLDADERFNCGIVDDVVTGIPVGVITLETKDRVGGIATSGRAGPGQGGRSFSLGIADAVTVLATTAATADVAATLIGNEVDVPDHSSIKREPATTLNPDSDLGTRQVVTAVGVLSHAEVAAALSRGERFAKKCLQRGLIHGAVLSLRGQRCMIGRVSAALEESA